MDIEDDAFGMHSDGEEVASVNMGVLMEMEPITRNEHDLNRNRRRLELLFLHVQFDDLSEPSLGPNNWQEEVCCLLESTPLLASEEFEDDDRPNPHYGFPLLFLVLNLANLAQIKRVYEMNTSAVGRMWDWNCQYRGFRWGDRHYLLHEAGANCKEIGKCPSAITLPDDGEMWAFHYSWMHSDYENNNGRDWETCEKLLGVGTEHAVVFNCLFLAETIHSQSRRLDLSFLIKLVVSMPYGPVGYWSAWDGSHVTTKDCYWTETRASYPPLKDEEYTRDSFLYLIMIICDANRYQLEPNEFYHNEDEKCLVVGLIYSLCRSTDVWRV